MARKADDPMSGLLSSVGGIDSALFQKPQSMRDMRGTGSPVRKAPEQALTPQSQQSSGEKQPNRQPAQAAVPTFASQSLKAQPQHQQQVVRNSKAPSDSNRHLDDLLGGGSFTKANRPMRDNAKPRTPQTEPNSALLSSANRPPERPTEKETGFFQPTAHDDLDTVFGRAADPQAQLGDSSDPFSLFGGLGTTEHAASQSAKTADLGSNLSAMKIQTSPLASQGSISRKAAVASPTASQHRPFSSGGSDDWGGMMTASPGLTSPASSTAAQESAFDSFVRSPSQRSSQTTPYSRSQHTSPDPVLRPTSERQQAAAPPSYESVSRKISSPRSKLVGQGSGKYRIYHDGDNVDELASSPPSRSHRRSSSSEKVRSRVAQQQQPQQEQIKEQAKQWLSAGQKWLSGASKKVAQAVKDTQAQINNKIDELEGRPPSDSSFSRKAQQTALSRQHSQNPPPKSLDDIPQYYFEWAHTIEALPSHEQGSTLAAMPSEDAATIQRILRHKSQRRSIDQAEGAMLAEAQRRSLSDAEPSAASTAPPRRTRSSELTPPATSRDREEHIRPTQSRSSRPHSANADSARKAERSRQEDNADLMGLEKGGHSRRSSAAQEGFGASASPLDSGDSDLMGMGSNPASEQPPPRPTAAPSAEEDFLGISEGVHPAARAGANLDDIFGGQSSQHSSQNEVSPELQELFGTRPAPRPQQGTKAQANSMIDFGDEADLAGHEQLYQPDYRDEEQEGEPEARKIARRRRLAEMHARMQKQLVDKQARDTAEQQQQEQQHQLRTYHRERIEAWKSGKKDNIRALLSTLHTVLWEESGWTPPQMTDLVDTSRVKRSYMKANLVVHPDKVKQKGGTVEQIVVADMAFDTLKNAWSKFEASELRSR